MGGRSDGQRPEGPSSGSGEGGVERSRGGASTP